VSASFRLERMDLGLFSWRKQAKETLKASRSEKLAPEDVLVIGAGISGIAVGIHLRREGIPFVVAEKERDVGGTWLVNCYPHCACDVPAHLYQFSFESKSSLGQKNWSRPYAPAGEIHEYLRGIVEKYDLRRSIRFNCPMKRAKWNDETHRWDVELEDGSTLSPRFLINCIGGLHYPSFPLPQEKLENFKGPWFHSSQWKDVDLKGKKVAVIGSAASAVQMVDAIAEEASKLVILQRTPNWVSTRAMAILPREKYAEWQNQLMSSMPLVERMHRLSIYIYMESLHLLGLFRHKSITQHRVQQMIESEMRSTLKGRPDLIEKVIPKYPIGCKRICRSDSYLPTLLKDNVELVPHGLVGVEENAIVDATGTKHDVDIVIYATGFEVGSLGNTVVEGPNGFYATGTKLLEEGQAAFLGVCAKDCPNMFNMLSANSGLGHNSIILMIETQAEYAAKTIGQAVDENIDELVIKPEVIDLYEEGVQKAFNNSVWTAPGCNSWYQNQDGKVLALWPNSTLSFFATVRNAPPMHEAYNFSKL